MNRGIVTVAFGHPARRCARALIRSIRKHSPCVPVCVIADRELPEADLTIERTPTWGGRYYKVNIDRFVPQEWRYVLYLDADTLVIDSLEPIFQFLEDGWDMVMTLGPDWGQSVGDNQRPHYDEENVFTAEALGGRFWHQPMGGVWAYQRIERTAAFHKLWGEEWERFGRRDQPAMVRALWRSPVTALWLGTEWNCFIHRGDTQRGEVVLHFPTAARTRSESKPPHPAAALWEEYSKRV